MKETFLREPIGDQVYFGSVRDERYKTNLLAVNLILPLKKETMTANALVPMILERGYEDYPTFQEFSKKLNFMYGASAGSSISKIGDRAVLTLMVSAIDDSYALNGEALLEESAKVLMGMLLRPAMKDGLFDEKTFALQRQYLIDTIEAEINDKRRYAMMKTISLMFEGEAFGTDRFGMVEGAKAITLNESVDAYHRIIDEATVEILHVGMGDPACAKEVCKRAFAPLNRHPVALPETDIQIGSGKVKNVTERFNVTQSKLCFGFKTDVTPDSPLLNPMRMAVAILGGTPTSKLFLNVREKKSLCYYCAARFDRTKGIMLIDSGVEHDKIDEAKKAILEQLDAVRSGEFTETDMEFASLSLQNSFRSMGESAYSLELYYLTQTVLGLTGSPEEQSQAIARVQKDEIIEAAKHIRLHTVYLLTGENVK